MDLLLRYEDARAPEHPLFERYARVETGVPGRCPVCSQYGFITALDVRRSLQTQHCRSCRYSWDYEFREDGTILEVRGHGPLPGPVAPEPAADPLPEAAPPVERRRVVVRRRNRPLRAARSEDAS